MLHQIIAPYSSGGCVKSHSKEFREAENLHPYYAASRNWKKVTFWSLFRSNPDEENVCLDDYENIGLKNDVIFRKNPNGDTCSDDYENIGLKDDVIFD